MSGPPMPRRAAAIAAEAFVVTYPLVLMDVTRAQLTATATPGALRAPVNRFAHMPGFPVAPSPVVAPNVDTLTSSAWVDLSGGPVVLSLPATGGRWYAMPMYDAWTTPFATLGTRTTGNGAFDAVLVPPRWRGSVPRELHEVRSPTTRAWIVGHIRSDGPGDHVAVRRLQQQIRLTPLSRWPEHGVEDPDTTAAARQLDATSPAAQVARMDPVEYFTRVARLLAVDPPHPADRGCLHRLETLGVAAGRPPAWSRDDRALVRQIARGMDEGLALVEAAAGADREDRAWTTPSDPIRDLPEPLQRAAMAWTGLGAWPPADGLVYTSDVRGNGSRLTGTRSHVLRFAPGAEPPARAFWSLSVLDREGFGVGRRGRRALGDRDPLWRAPDGSLTIHLSAGPPRSAATNWLPTPPGPFGLVLRLYWPEPSALDGSWWPPAVDLADEVSGREAVVPPVALG